MDGDNSRVESEGGFSNQELRDRIRERDELTPSPEIRAKFILDLIQDHNKELTNWDILCFCSEYLGSQVLIYEWLESELVQRIATRVQLAHYLNDELPDTGVI